MKKIIAIVMTAVMLLAMLVPVGASAPASPVKDYETAQNGDLLYTVDFRGDAAFTPDRTTSDAGNYDYEVSADGTAVRIKPKAGAADSTANLWGGIIEDLPATDETIYSMVYQAKANGTVGKNNSVGVGGWAVGEAGFNATNGVYNIYANHNTVTDTGSREHQRGSLSQGISKLGDSEWTTKDGGYVKYGTQNIAVDSDGFMTVLVVYDGTEYQFASYVLLEGATDLKAEASWLALERNEMTTALVNPEIQEYMCFWTYAFYNVIDTTIKNVRYYKNYLWAEPDATTPATTEEPTTPAATTAAPTTAEPTKAPETKAPETTAAVEEKKGCGGTVTVAGIALVATLGTCAVFVEKKRK